MSVRYGERGEEAQNNGVHLGAGEQPAPSLLSATSSGQGRAGLLGDASAACNGLLLRLGTTPHFPQLFLACYKASCVFSEVDRNQGDWHIEAAEHAQASLSLPVLSNAQKASRVSKDLCSPMGKASSLGHYWRLNLVFWSSLVIWGA